MHGEILESLEGVDEKLQGETLDKKIQVSLEEKNAFQREVFKILIDSGKLDKKNADEMYRYGEIISGVIDEPQNLWIRELILQKNFKDAARAMADAIIIESDKSGEI